MLLRRIEPCGPASNMRERLMEFHARRPYRVRRSASEVLEELARSPATSEDAKPAAAFRLLNRWASVLLRRIANEERGDYHAEIDVLARRGQWRAAWWCAARSIGSTAVNSLTYVVRRWAGRQRT
jgi:hypothetical protein